MQDPCRIHSWLAAAALLACALETAHAAEPADTVFSENAASRAAVVVTGVRDKGTASGTEDRHAAHGDGPDHHRHRRR